MANDTYTFPSVVIQSYLTITAKRWGMFPTITLQHSPLVSGAGFEIVSLSPNLSSITVLIDSGVSTMASVAAAINASANPANIQLQPGDLVSAVATAGHLSATVTASNVAIPLANGVTTTAYASAIVQDITYTAVAAGNVGNYITVKYIPGAFAGSEVVTVSGKSITVSIQSGVSTATQVAAAVNASTPATNLVSVSISGLGSNFQSALGTPTYPLFGGTNSDFALIDGIVYTAITPGASSGITITYANNPADTVPVVTHVSSAITVTFNSGVTTALAIINAINTSSNSDTLVYASWFTPAKTPYFMLNGPQLYTAASSPVSLSGGATPAPAAATVGGVTVTSITDNAAQNGLTVTYIPGATAGSEVVSVDSFGNVTVQIQSGTSTVTQVRTAMNASTPFSALYLATGTSATVVTTTANFAMTGAAGPNDLGYYSDQSITPLTASFVEFQYNFIARIITIANDDTSGPNRIAWSFDGVNLHGTAGFSQAITWDVPTGNVIYLKYINGAPAYRLIVKGE